MRYTKFIIKNFKGIEEAEVHLTPEGANVFALIGLNESGKTTILEALNIFGRSDNDTRALYDKDAAAIDPLSFVPKSRIFNFSGTITISAHLSLTEEERDEIIRKVQEDNKCKVDASSIPLDLRLDRGFRFENSDLTRFISVINTRLSFTRKGKRKAQISVDDDPEWRNFAMLVNKSLPDIVYFPTFLFSQPARIYLFSEENREDETPVNRQYRMVIENLAGSLKYPVDVQKHIVDRYVTAGSKQNSLSLMSLSADKQEQIYATLTELSSHLTKTVFTSWSKVFGGDFTGREISLRSGAEVIKGDRTVYIEILLRDRTSTYSISERSLGFRWFFSFLLFTLYRKASRSASTTIFLLDEPAANLHSQAQMQLIESFPKIASAGSVIIYSTHSHYMINPEWLDQAFIVANWAVDYNDFTGAYALSKSQQTDVRISKYRDFVGQNPDKFTYFQPVLDKLNVAPSKLDLVRCSLLVEGKGDYLIVEYALTVILQVTRNYAVVPTRGAAGMDELIGLLMGWAVPFAICLDDDHEGSLLMTRYIDEWALPKNRVFTLKLVDEDLKGKSIEGLLEDSDYDLIKEHFNISSKPTKSQTRLFFSEMLSKKKIVNVSDPFKRRVGALDNLLRDLFAK